jgi:hypothetical protein
MSAFTNNLQPGESLFIQDYLVSSNGRYQLRLQQDGNLVLYDLPLQNKAIWNSKTNGREANFAIMQADGNFVLYGENPPGSPLTSLWSTGTAGDTNAFLILQDDGNLVMYKVSAADAKWSTQTAGQ